ncbi:MAG: hypothetical protein QME47_06740 [Candidatus Thermoplasmatota archaeon]|nr:hypothetical protein [Candidatus Thermoplasmatota archaeon]
MYNYTLEDLQEWYGRKNGDVSKLAKPLVLEKINEKCRRIAEEAINFVNTSYAQQPTPLSIRQVHYHLVHQLAEIYSNTIKDYKILIKLMLQARIAGLIPWHMISETESLVSEAIPAGMNPEDAIKKALEDAQKQAGKSPWDAMGKRVVVFTEKRELQPQLEYVTNNYFVRLISLRGYGAWSRLYRESLEYQNFMKDRNNYELYAYFVTDHDPSGLDINRLYASILKNFWKLACKDHRVMLRKDQVDAEVLPPAPTKVKDPRAKWYIRKFSTDCWEVDALGREKMQKILEEEIKKIIDFKVWDEVMKENAENVEKTKKIAEEMMKGKG